MHKLISTIIISTAIFFTGCEQQSVQTLKVGISPWPGYEPLMLALEKNFYDTSQVRIIRFSTPTQSYRALRDGIIDVAAFTADEVIHYAESKHQPRIFLILDISNGADAIVAKKEIKTLADLKGKRLGVEGSALGDYVMHRAMDFTKDLKVSDLILKSAEISNQEQLFIQDEIDAAVTYEPSKSLLINAGAHVIFDSSQIPYEIVDVLVTNDKTVQTRADDLKNLAQGWFKAQSYISKNYKKAMHKMSQSESTTVDEFQKGYEDLIIPTKADNLKMLGENASLLEPLQRLSKLMYIKGSLGKEIDVKPLLDKRIVESLQE